MSRDWLEEEILKNQAKLNDCLEKKSLLDKAKNKYGNENISYSSFRNSFWLIYHGNEIEFKNFNLCDFYDSKEHIKSLNGYSRIYDEDLFCYIYSSEPTKFFETKNQIIKVKHDYYDYRNVSIKVNDYTKFVPNKKISFVKKHVDEYILNAFKQGSKSILDKDSFDYEKYSNCEIF